MIGYCLLKLAPKKRASLVVQCATLTAMIGLILVFNACSGASGIGTKSIGTGNPTGAGLAISATLPQASVGSTYSGSLTASGGTAPYTFAVVSGQMPQGVSLADSTGTISGTPTASGKFSFGVSVSDSKGASRDQSLVVTVANATTASTPAPTSPPPATPPPNTPSPTAPTSPVASSGGTSPSNLQHSGGWSQYGQGPPNFVDCSPSPCDGISFSMTQGVQSPSRSGHATTFNVGGSTPYSDALFSNHLIGPLSSQGMFDPGQKQVASLYNFTYDVYFYGDNWAFRRRWSSTSISSSAAWALFMATSVASPAATNGMSGTTRRARGPRRAFPAFRTAIRGTTLRSRCNGHPTII
jgi:hypothetical protein